MAKKDLNEIIIRETKLWKELDFCLWEFEGEKYQGKFKDALHSTAVYTTMKKMLKKGTIWDYGNNSCCVADVTFLCLHLKGYRPKSKLFGLKKIKSEFDIVFAYDWIHTENLENGKAEIYQPRKMEEIKEIINNP